MLFSGAAIADVNWGTPPVPPTPPAAPAQTMVPGTELNNSMVKPANVQVCKYKDADGKILYTNYTVDPKKWKLVRCF